MYLKHFNLKEFPFSLTPNTQFFLNMASYHEAYNMLMVSLSNLEGFIKVVGEVGTGKTMLCRKVLNTLSDRTTAYVTAYMPNPVLTPMGLFLAFAEELGLEVEPDLGQHSLLKSVNARLIELASQKKQVILFIDEAHAMPEETLEALRLLTNLETEKAKLFQVVLFAQPELDQLLNRPSLRQLQQRITFSCRLEPLDHKGVERYIIHRLSRAGYDGPFMFGRRALDCLTEASRGIPRLVNILCHKALLVAYGKGERLIREEHVRRAVEDTEGVQVPRTSSAPAFIAAAGIVFVGVGAALLLFFGSAWS